MSLREMYEKCKKAQKGILRMGESIERMTSQAILIGRGDHINTSRYIAEYKEFYNYVDFNLDGVPYISELNRKLKGCIDKEGDNLSSLKRHVEKICDGVCCIISLYEFIEKRDANSIGLDIKIPETDDITELKKFIDGLEFIFTKCPFFQNNKESLKLQAVDNGSIWLIFGVVGVSVAAGSVLLNNIVAFIDKCFVVKSHKLTCEMQKQHIENEEMEQNEKHELLKSVDKLYKIGVKNVIKELEVGTGYQIQDGDEMGRVEQSFDRMIKMLDQGLQIYSSIDSPEEVKALFKPLEMQYLSIAKGLERIEEKSDTENE